VLEHGEKYESEPWSNMKKVVAFKVDLMSVDQIRVLFEYESGFTIEVSEDMIGFQALLNLSANKLDKFPQLEDWKAEVVLPPFEPSTTVLWEKYD